MEILREKIINVAIIIDSQIFSKNEQRLTMTKQFIIGIAPNFDLIKKQADNKQRKTSKAWIEQDF